MLAFAELKAPGFVLVPTGLGRQAEGIGQASCDSRGSNEATADTCRRSPSEFLPLIVPVLSAHPLPCQVAHEHGHRAQHDSQDAQSPSSQRVTRYPKNDP